MFTRATLAALVLSPTALAQTPETPPAPLPSSIAPPAVRLPQDENLQPFSARTLNMKRGTTWQLWAGGRVFRDFGNDVDTAHEVARVLRELNPMAWASVGTDRPVVEYGLTPDEQGRPVPPRTGGFPKLTLTIDHRTARVENVRGAWCVRDDASILLNCGPHHADAEMALAVARKYGFNRIGLVGKPTPVFAYFYAQPEINAAPPAGDPALRALAAANQEKLLTRTGIEVPGVGFVGEQLTIDPRKVEVRRERGVFSLTHGPDVLAKFGGSEWAARDALRLIQDGRFTEFCRFGTEGVTFFLKDGRAPQGVPFYAQGQRFDPKRLVVRGQVGKWWVCEGGRSLLPAGSAAEAETLVRLVQAYGFDQLAQVGPSPSASLKLLAKAR